MDNSLKTESGASAGDVRFWQSMQKPKAKVPLPKPKSQSVKKNSKSRKSSKT